ncbi:hypothetical protein TNCV_715201 [Trichonephila clavipes]|nr:hypothetical protein TNCV_715201 [Trichonephila clavipes]
MIRKVLFNHSRLLRKAPVMVRVVNSRPELSGKFATISHIRYQIQIALRKVPQGSSFRSPRLLSDGDHDDDGDDVHDDGHDAHGGGGHDAHGGGGHGAHGDGDHDAHGDDGVFAPWREHQEHTLEPQSW